MSEAPPPGLHSGVVGNEAAGIFDFVFRKYFMDIKAIVAFFGHSGSDEDDFVFASDPDFGCEVEIVDRFAILVHHAAERGAAGRICLFSSSMLY